MDDLGGIRAVVTGSTRGLGEAIARDLAGRGACVVVNGTDRERCETIALEIGGRAVAGSVADEDTAERLVAAYDGVDLLINNAGSTRDGMLTRLDADAFDAVVGVHLRGSWLTSRAAARWMRKNGGGSIVNVVSGTALFGNPGQSPYAAAKGGMLAMTRALSIELGRDDIRVNAISPVARTSMVDPLLSMAPDDAELASHFGEPASIAPLVSALASSEVTGQVIGFDGRRLSFWSHPDVLHRDERDRWDVDGLRSALDGAPAELHPDALGVAVQRLMGFG